MVALVYLALGTGIEIVHADPGVRRRSGNEAIAEDRVERR